MRDNNFLQALFAAVAGALTAYLNILLIPVLVLIVAMIIDYCTGMVTAYCTATLNSRIGIKGILKKVGYLCLVAVGMVTDYLITSALLQVGIEMHISMCIGMIITIWLIINELISVLENLAKIGVPVPEFVKKLIDKLKNTVDDTANM